LWQYLASARLVRQSVVAIVLVSADKVDTQKAVNGTRRAHLAIRSFEPTRKAGPSQKRRERYPLTEVARSADSLGRSPAN